MLRIDLNDDTKFTIPRAGGSLLFLKRYRSSLEWLLDIAARASPEHHAAIDRLRKAVRGLSSGGSAQIKPRDLKIAFAIVLAAIERDLGPISSRPRLGFPKRDDLPAVPQPHLAISLVGNVEWGLAMAAGDWRPLLHRYLPELEWLLDVAYSTTVELKDPRQRDAIARVRTGLRQLAAGSDPHVEPRDLRAVATLVLVAMERDLGRVQSRPAGRFRTTHFEVLVEGAGQLFGWFVKKRIA